MSFSGSPIPNFKDSATVHEGRIINNFWLRWGLIVATFLFIGIYRSGINLLFFIGQRRPIDWNIALNYELFYWIIWIFLVPALLVFARRFRLERKRIWRHLAAHFAFALMVSFVQMKIWLIFQHALFPGAGQNPVPIPSILFSFNIPLSTMGILNNIYHYWIIAGIYYMLDYLIKHRDREIKASRLQAQLVQAELTAMKIQIHPHFLFNTLHTIAAKARKNDNSTVIKMLVSLGDLLRKTMDYSHQQEVPLQIEMELLDNYLEIQQERFSSRLKINKVIDPGAHDVLVPNFLLQPIVENAIIHGVDKKDSIGTITIKVRKLSDHLFIEVKDDGPGLPNDWDKDSHSGLGVSNTRKRIEQLYGSNGSLLIDNRSSGGVVVTIRIPIHHVDLPVKESGYA